MTVSSEIMIFGVGLMITDTESLYVQPNGVLNSMKYVVVLVGITRNCVNAESMEIVSESVIHLAIYGEFPPNMNVLGMLTESSSGQKEVLMD